jgi:hypothetical protein
MSRVLFTGEPSSLLGIHASAQDLPRVAVPPKDQQHVDRLGLLYFSRCVLARCKELYLMSIIGNRPHNDVRLSTIKESPVLQREGYTQNQFESTNNSIPTMEGTLIYSLNTTDSLLSV